MYAAWVTGIDLPQARQLFQAFRFAKEIANEGLRIDRAKAWHKLIACNMRNVTVKGDRRQVWRFCNRLMGRKQKDEVEHPLFNVDGISVCSKPKEINQRFAQHFASLASDPEGFSSNKDYWEENFPTPPPRNGISNTLNGINHQIMWPEVNMFLHKLRDGKAAGMDGVPNEFLKVAHESFKLSDRRHLTPQGSLGKVILLVVRALFETGVIPRKWNTAVVTAIYKGTGEKRDCGNYRGISVTSSILNLTSKIVAARLSSALERVNALPISQAGFRKLEECPTHSIALYECLKRRSNL